MAGHVAPDPASGSVRTTPSQGLFSFCLFLSDSEIFGFLLGVIAIVNATVLDILGQSVGLGFKRR